MLLPTPFSSQVLPPPLNLSLSLSKFTVRCFGLMPFLLSLSLVFSLKLVILCVLRTKIAVAVFHPLHSIKFRTSKAPNLSAILKIIEFCFEIIKVVLLFELNYFFDVWFL